MKIQVTFVLSLFLGIAPAVWGQTAGSPSRPQYTLKINSRVVLTDVTVTDKHGNPITSLTANDFQLLDNGKPQNVASFEEHRHQQSPHLVEASATPGSFNNEYLKHPPAQVNALLFDTTTIAVEDQMYLFQQMKQFVENLPAGEPVAVFTRWGSMTIELSSFTDDHAKLMAAIAKAIPRLQQPGAWIANDLETLQQIAAYMDQIPGKKNLLWFTSGSNMLLGLGPYSMLAGVDADARREVYDMLEAERIAVYPIDARGLTVVSGSVARATVLQHMQMYKDADTTGGTAYVNTNGLAQAAQRILETDGNYYTLTYTPNDLKGNRKWHHVQVKLLNSNYQLSYRHGYFDESGNPQATRKSAPALPVTRNRVAAMDDRVEPIVFSVRIAPVSPSAVPQPGDSPLKKGETRYVVEYHLPAKDVNAARIQGNEGTDELGAAVFVYDHNGELVGRKGLKYTLHIDEQKARDLPNARLNFVQTVNLPKGSNYLYLGVWDMTTGRMGTVNASVDVKKPTS